VPKPKPAPTTAEELLAALKVAHAELAAELLRLREQALARGVGTTWTIEFVEGRLALVEEAIAQVSAQVLGPPGEFGMAANLVQQGYAVGLNLTAKSLTLQGVTDVVEAAMTDFHVPAMLAIAQEATDGYQGLYQAVLRRENDAYRKIQAHFAQVALAKGETGSELTGRLAREFVDAEMQKGGVMVGLKRNWAIEDYAEMLGRTVAQKAAREAGLNRVVETGNDLVIVIGGRIETTCKTCLWADGKVFSISNQRAKPDGVPEALWGGPIELIKVEHSTARDRRVGKKNSPPVGHPRCLLPGTRVVAPNLLGATRAWYVGEAVELSLASGARLSVTANHVLLGPEGWVRAGSLCQGDYVVYAPGLERVMGTQPEYDKMPPLVEHVFAAALVARGMSTMTMPVSAEDLHGDGCFCQGQIEVVAPDSLLGDCGPPPFGQSLSNQFLHSAPERTLEFAGDSQLTPELIRLGLASDSIVGSLRDTPPSFWSERRHAYPMLFRARSPGDAPVLDSLIDGSLGYTKVPLEIANAMPGGIELCEVVSVNRASVSAHVYDLHSLSSLYVCSGVVSSNCIHDFGAYIPEATTEESIEELRTTLEEYADDLGLDIANGGQIGGRVP
jgi:hypothetical protein